MMKSHCQLLSPAIVGMAINAPEIGEPIAVESGAAAMNAAAATARCRAGNHWLR